MGSADVTGAIGTYNPSGALGIIGSLCFLVVDIALWFRYFKTQPRAKWMINICIACFFMAIGFLLRFSRRNGIDAWKWLFETIFLLCGPCAFLAQVYVTLPRLSMYLEADHCLYMNRRAIVKVFVWLDLLTVLAQLAGTALQATFGDLIRIGIIVTTAGLWFQIICFAWFISLFVVFSKRLRRSGQEVSLKSAGSVGWRDRLHQWETLYWAVWFQSGCMVVRTTFRIIEYTASASGARGISDNEAVFYIFDGIPMLLLALSFVIVWPPSCLPEVSGIVQHSPRGYPLASR